MKEGTFVHKAVTVNATSDLVTVDPAMGKSIKLTPDAARSLLHSWEPYMATRGHFIIVLTSGAFRSADVKSTVRCLRQVFA